MGSYFNADAAKHGLSNFMSLWKVGILFLLCFETALLLFDNVFEKIIEYLSDVN